MCQQVLRLDQPLPNLCGQVEGGPEREPVLEFKDVTCF
jgi:hypothetical protein